MNNAGFTRAWTLALSFCIALVVAACGSDDGGTPAPPDGGPITVTGTAATGMAIADGALEIRCTTGGATTTTAADGNYSVELSEDAELPCVLRVTLADGSMLHSVLASGSTVANVTPVTELVVARLGGQSAADYFDNFDNTAGTTLADDDYNYGVIQSAVDVVVATLAAAGVDFGPDVVDNVLTGELIAGTGGAPGNAYDQQLDVLGQKLAASGTTLATLADEIIRTIPTDPQAGLSSVASLPADLLLSPAATNCTALRSGSYRYLVLMPSAGADVLTEVATVDAAALTLTRQDGSVQQWEASGPCSYTTAAGEQAVVSQAGLVVARIASGEGYVGVLLFPEQVIVDDENKPTSENVAQLAGNWNAVGLQRLSGGGTTQLTTSTFTLNGAGTVRALTQCAGVGNECTTYPATQVPAISLAIDPAGGFSVTNASDGTRARAFAYRAGGGELMMVMLSLDGQLSFATRQLAAALPHVDDTRETWTLGLGTNLAVASGFVDGQSVVTSVDEAQNLYVRDATIDFGTGVTRPETIVINDPRDGYLYRPEATVTASDGSPSVVTERLALPLLGMGLSPVAVPADNGLNLTVQKQLH